MSEEADSLASAERLWEGRGISNRRDGKGNLGRFGPGFFHTEGLEHVAGVLNRNWRLLDADGSVIEDHSAPPEWLVGFTKLSHTSVVMKHRHSLGDRDHDHVIDLSDGKSIATASGWD